MVEAEITSLKAKAAEDAGLAEVRVLEQRLEAEATGEEKMGQARAAAREAQARAEANGLVEKLKAYDVMSSDAREFEQFRMNLELLEKETMAGIEMQRVSVQENGRVMAEALKGAKFELIGGDGGIFDTFSKGLGIGKGVQGVMEKAPALQAVMAGLAGSAIHRATAKEAVQ